MTIDATAHKKQYELLPPEKKAKLTEARSEQRHEHLTEEEKKISAQGLLLLLSMKGLILINQLLNFYVNIFTRIQHWHRLIFIVVQQILVWQYPMTKYNQTLMNQ
jgi:hypothetical protein